MQAETQRELGVPCGRKRGGLGSDAPLRRNSARNQFRTCARQADFGRVRSSDWLETYDITNR